MDEYTYTTQESSEYGTGRTQPPKSRGGLVALLLILVIFLTGIVTVLGILNIQLFRQLRAQDMGQEASISFSQLADETQPAMAAAQAEEPLEDNFSMDLTLAPQAPANVPQEGALSLQDIYRKNIPSVVSINSAFLGGSSSGTGVVLSSDGFIVTNAHLVAEAVSVTVRLSDDRVFQARIIGRDTASDLAVIQIDAQDLVPASFGDSSTLQVGDAVVAIGDPLGTELRGTMTDGIISAINRDIILEGRAMSLIQTNAALNEGNSGGPLIDAYGNVVGINTMVLGDLLSAYSAEGLGFAIPSATVKNVVDQLVSQGYVSGRPTLGIDGETLSVFYQHYYHLPAGLYLTQVRPGSGADLAGLAPGDILLAIDGQPILTGEDLDRVLYAADIGDHVTLTVYRAGEQGTLTLTVEEDTDG